MFYQILRCSSGVVAVLFKMFWFACNLTSAGIPWFASITLIICGISMFVKTKRPNEKQLSNLFGNSSDLMDENSPLFWPIANRGADYDAPENSKAALQKCSNIGCRKILFDVGLSACGKIVIISRSTLEKAGLTLGVSKHTLDEMRRINLTELHPLCAKFQEEHVLTLTDLMDNLKIIKEFTIFLRINDNSTQMFEQLKLYIRDHMDFTKHFVLVTTSMITIYQLRKLYPELLCGVWIEYPFKISFLQPPSLISTIHDVVLRNLIVPVIGISFVFICKEEFHLQSSKLWRDVGVRPIVYYINSPSEKRYFQRIMKTQYLTDSLRSEPYAIAKSIT